MRNKEFKELLSKHDKWLMEGRIGKPVNFHGITVFEEVLENRNLSFADLRNVKFINTQFTDSIFWHADLSHADISWNNLSFTDLRKAKLIGTNFNGVCLRGARLEGAEIKNVKHDEYTAFFALQCPEEGSFIGFKKVITKNGDLIVKLLIPDDAKRSSATSRKCRCDKAKVIAILNPDKSDSGLKEIFNSHYCGTKYRIGEIVYSDSWTEDRWVECGHGIHFFITFDEALNY